MSGSLFARAFWALVVAASVGCVASTAGGPEDWSRSFAAEYDTVLEAVLASLDDMDFILVEVDEGRREVRADASTRRGDGISLVIFLEDRAFTTGVDVMARGGDAGDGRVPTRMASVVTELLRRTESLLRSSQR